MAREYDLTTDAIGAQPVPYQWDGDKFGQGWDIVYPDPEAWSEKYRREWWGEHSTDEYPDDESKALDKLRDLIGESTDSWSPMMSYYYPLPEFRGDASEAQAKLDEAGAGACCLALVDDELVLVLSGGGMDLSWDICRAYIALGYFPPAHYAGKLPNQGEADTRTAAICVESCRIAVNWAKGSLDSARSALKNARAVRAERKAAAH